MSFYPSVTRLDLGAPEPGAAIAPLSFLCAFCFLRLPLSSHFKTKAESGCLALDISLRVAHLRGLNDR